MGWVKDKGANSAPKFQLGGQVNKPGGNAPMNWHGESNWHGGTKPPNEPKQQMIWKKGGKVKSSSKYSMKELVDLSKKHDKTVEEIKEIIDAGPKYGKKQRPPKIKYRRPHG